MSLQVRYEADFKPGDCSWHASDGPSGPYSAVFEDDGDTGYFCALSRGLEQPILDAVHIYNVQNVTDRHIPSIVQIVWSSDGHMAALVLNRHPHAVIDFPGRRMCCRTGFPPPSGEFATSHAWDEALMSEFLSR